MTAKIAWIAKIAKFVSQSNEHQPGRLVGTT